MLHSGVPEPLSKGVTLDLKSRYLLVLIGRYRRELGLFEHKRLHGTIVDRRGFVLTLSYHDVYPGLVTVHRVEDYLRVK